MRSNKGPGFWAFLTFAVVVFAQSPALFSNASVGQAPPDAPQSKPKAAVQVKGKVVDRDGKGMANAEVTFAGPKGEIKKTTTNPQGSFTYELEPGKYKIIAKSGAKSTSMQVEIGNNTHELSLILE